MMNIAVIPSITRRHPYIHTMLCLYFRGKGEIGIYPFMQRYNLCYTSIIQLPR